MGTSKTHFNSAAFSDYLEANVQWVNLHKIFKNVFLKTHLGVESYKYIHY